MIRIKLRDKIFSLGWYNWIFFFFFLWCNWINFWEKLIIIWIVSILKKDLHISSHCLDSSRTGILGSNFLTSIKNYIYQFYINKVKFVAIVITTETIIFVAIDALSKMTNFICHSYCIYNYKICCYSYKFKITNIVAIVTTPKTTKKSPQYTKPKTTNFVPIAAHQNSKNHG